MGCPFLCVRISVHMCPFVISVRIYRTTAKVKIGRMALVDFGICRRNTLLRNCIPWPWPVFWIQMFKIFVICSFRMLPAILNYEKNQLCTFIHLRSKGISDIFALRDLGLHFRFQLFKIYEICSFHMILVAKNYEKNQQYTQKYLQWNHVSLLLIWIQIQKCWVIIFRYRIIQITENMVLRAKSIINYIIYL